MATATENLPGPARLLTVEDLAALLKCSKRTVRRLVDCGRVPRPVRINGLLRFRATDITTWIEAGCESVSL